ncbi:IclR family transcriptional regulator domain-containing protein [Streptomyces sp. NRRL S-813]|uniref:IclR family transcriptional regulator domain-containing protein n=1 Tax=Streptomyces sp. NRRL S-813 TaxID=1463919 RepID=UPI000ADA32A0|nr:IclR family transcriptional regulator C-terminal domain-containing protein [Streptomyces sp. NRRL S-813]
MWGAAWCFFAKTDPAAESWVGEIALEILKGRAEQVADALEAHAAAAELDGQRGPLPRHPSACPARRAGPGGEALLVERLSARDASPVRYRVGGRLPLTSTGVGLVLLAFAPPAVQEQAIAAYAPELGDDDIRTPADLRRALAEVRRGDHAVGHQNRPWRVSTIAAPVRDGSEVVAALSVVAPGTGSPNPGYGPAVRATARAISRRLVEDGGRTVPVEAADGHQ